MVAELICHYDLDGLNKKSAQFLYTGILTDTGRFLHPSTTSKTFEIARILNDAQFNRN
jgi:phosphoesterase RecJ-like protein